jgi:hypothetical protein
MTAFPRYYQKDSVCIKRESATQGKQVIIPEACRINAFGFKVINTRDKLSFDAMVYEMNEVSFEVYERYLIILHQFTQKQPAGFRETHQLTPEFATGSTFRNPS